MPAEGLGTVGVAKKVAPPGGLGFSFLVNTCPVSIRFLFSQHMPCECTNRLRVRLLVGGGRGGGGGGREREGEREGERECVCERERERERAWVSLVRFCKCVHILLRMCVLIFCECMCPHTAMYVCLAEREFGRV
jgi:hypothetical protein